MKSAVSDVSIPQGMVRHTAWDAVCIAGRLGQPTVINMDGIWSCHPPSRQRPAKATNAAVVTTSQHTLVTAAISGSHFVLVGDGGDDDIFLVVVVVGSGGYPALGVQRQDLDAGELRVADKPSETSR